jgi:hypothetical protein
MMHTLTILLLYFSYNRQLPLGIALHRSRVTNRPPRKELVGSGTATMMSREEACLTIRFHIIHTQENGYIIQG